MTNINIQVGHSEPKPHSPGDKFGKLTVLEFVVRSAQNQNSGKWLSKPLNWYRVKCDCGHVETVNQQILAPSGRRQCLECCAIDKARAVSAARHQTPEPMPVPDFARIRW